MASAASKAIAVHGMLGFMAQVLVGAGVLSVQCADCLVPVFCAPAWAQLIRRLNATELACQGKRCACVLACTTTARRHRPWWQLLR